MILKYDTIKITYRRCVRSTNMLIITSRANKTEYINKLRELVPVAYNCNSKVRIYNIQRYKNDYA